MIGPRWKYIVLVLMLGLLATGYVVRLGYLQIYKHDFFRKKSQFQLKRIVTITPKRGHITDRNSVPLAVTKTSYSVYGVPHQIEDKVAFAKAISPILNMPEDQIVKIVTSESPFVWIKRKASRESRNQIRALKLSGINFIRENSRLYPKHLMAGQILGFVGTDRGLGGMEYQYNRHLEGTPGQIVLEGDPRGFQIVTGTRKIRPSVDGGNIVLTLDERIQHLAESALATGVQNFEAKQGIAIVMSAKSGEILAMANYPFFNPKRYWKFDSTARKNSAVINILEPGSVMKPISIAAAIEENLVSPEMELKVPEQIVIANRTIREAHRREEGESDIKTVTDILKDSLNVGTTMIAQKLGEAKLYRYLRGFGFGQSYNIGLPGETGGILRPLSQWSAVDIGMISFGQGIAVTPLQLTAAIGTIANHGERLSPRIIKTISDQNGSQVQSTRKTVAGRPISAKTAKSVTDMMVQVVENGTGQRVKIRGYKIAGKTGTAQKALENGRGYSKTDYNALFVGFFPADDPQYVITVIVDTPQGSIYGSTVAGPIFREISKGIIDYKSIPPNPRYLAKDPSVPTPNASAAWIVGVN